MPIKAGSGGGVENHEGKTKEDRQSDHMKMSGGPRTNRNESYNRIMSSSKKNKSNKIYIYIFGACSVAPQGIYPV